MAQMTWTEEQQNILNCNKNVIVSAAAGSGKTAVLTEKIANKVSEGADICDMLVVTFTKNAASEMKQRIEKTLFERAESEADANKKKHMLLQAQSTSIANISTLHSFCTYLLKRNFYKVELSPSFRVGNSTEIEMLRDEALDEALNEFFEDEQNTKLLKVMGEAELSNAILDIYDNISIRSDGKEWLLNAVKNYSISKEEFEHSSPIKYLLQKAKKHIANAIEYIKSSYDYTESEKESSILDEKLDAYKHMLEDSDDYSSLFDTIQMKVKGFQGIKNLNPTVKTLCTNASSSIKDSKVLVELSIDTLYNNIINNRKYIEQIAGIVLRFDEIFKEKKNKNNIIDYSDMEQKTLQLLKDTSVRKAYKDKFKYIFVDEFQDINDIQNEIIKSLISDDNGFFVGDIKQSIYRFRGAKPALFIQKEYEYSKSDNADCMKLSANFRSSDAVVNFVNMIFSSIMKKSTGGIDYDESQSLKKKSQCGKGKVYIEYIETETQSSEQNQAEDDDEINLQKIEAQAIVAANKIREMVGNTKFFDIKEKRERFFTYSDFAVIMRSVKQAPLFARELMLAGIPVHIEGAENYFSAIEVQVLINLLSVIDNRRQDIPLISVMRSPIGNFSDNELTKIRIIAKEEFPDASKKTFYETMNFVSGLEYDVSIKIKKFLDKLDDWNKRSKLIQLEELVRVLLDETGYYRFISSLPGGKGRAGNLDVFAQLARAYESDTGRGLYDFLIYLDKAKIKSDTKAAQTTAHNSVRVMTMHKSKGLEFNAVIVPSLEKHVISHLPSNNIIVYDDEGLGAKLQDENNAEPDIYHKIVSYKNTLACIEDEMRLMYVTFTRARDTLILLSCVPDTAGIVNQINPELEQLTKSSVLYVNWINYALLQSGKISLLEEAKRLGKPCGDELCIEVFSSSSLTLSEHSENNQEFFNEYERIKKIDYSEIKQDRDWIYPYDEAVKISSKGSVTEFAHEDNTVSYLQSSANKNSLISAAERGIATHLILSLIPFEKHTKQSVNAFAKNLTVKGILTDEEYKSINFDGIAEIFKRPLAKRIINSEKFLREQPFTCFIDASILSDKYQENEQILVQGIIDGCFMENGKWVIIDYKTDNVIKESSDMVEKQAFTHKKQLTVYKLALEKITGIEVSECHIIFVNAYDVRVI